MNTRTTLRPIILLSVVTALTPASLVADELPSPTLRPGTPLTAAELARLLDAQVWKLSVALPAETTRVDVKFRIKEKGHEDQPWGVSISGLIDKDTKGELMIAIIPLNDTRGDAEKVRVVVTGFGVFASTTAENPFKKLAIGRPETPEDNKDGSFNLIGGYKSSNVTSPISSADKVLTLKILTKK